MASDTNTSGERRGPRLHAALTAFAGVVRFAARSALTLRVLAVNVLALAMLAAGLLYLDRYQQGLIDAELKSLEARASLIAGALGESAVDLGDALAPELSPDMAKPLLRRLVAPGRDRARLFGLDGSLLSDSALLWNERGAILVQPLPSTEAPGPLLRLAYRAYEWVFGSLPRPTRDGAPPGDYPEARRALDGEPAAELYLAPDGRMLLSVAVPVQRYRQVLGALQLSRDSSEIDAAIRRFRLDILSVFALALAVTAALSIYLASTIARPIRRLAEAADQVRATRLGRAARRVELPDFSHRQDEIGRLSASLRQMTEALSSRIDAIERFAADVAHEIKNPLSSIRSAVETIGRVSDPEAQARLLAIVRDDVRRLDRLISDIAGASRVEAELSRAEAGPVDLARLLAALAEVHAATAAPDAPRLVFDNRAGSGPALVEGVEDRLIQVFANLVDNARSFSPPGGVIRLVLARAGKGLTAMVEDDGPGFPPEHAERLFERFYTARPEGEAFGLHSGLGLAICRQIVAAHQGTIRAEPRAEGGARLIVELPERPARAG